MMRVDDSYQGGVTVTPSDTVNITFPSGTQYSKGIFIGVAGDVTALMADGTTLTFKAMTAGEHRMSVKRINSTSTTATNILALY